MPISNKSQAEEILDKYYPKERTVFKEAILKAMNEYGEIIKVSYRADKDRTINEFLKIYHNGQI